LKPQNLLIYYGYPNSFNSSVNSWDNDKVAEDMSKYMAIVLGAGVENSSHPDYSNTCAIIPKIRAINPNCKIFGYVTVNQNANQFETKTDDWDALGVDGIFMDEAGYDYGNTSSNGRDAFNDKVDYVHSLDMICFVNAWNINHVLGTENDASYPNTTWNPSLNASNLDEEDIYLFESLAVNTLVYSDYETMSQWITRAKQAISFKDTHGLLMAGVAVIDDNDGDAQDLFDFSYVSALMAELDYFGSSSHYYGSGGSVKFWDRLDLYELDWCIYTDNIHNSLVDTDVVVKYLSDGKLYLDFSSGSEESGIVIY